MPAVLVLVVLLSMLAASVAVGHLGRARVVAQDIHEAEALYAAEAGLTLALARLASDPAWRPAGEPVPLPSSSEAVALSDTAGAPSARETDTPPQVYLRALGGYVEVASVARRGRAEATVTAQVAQRPPEALRA
ncbi:MAG: hypothetical protein AAGG50_07705, partial [Bacteroidota bacterium]